MVETVQVSNQAGVNASATTAAFGKAGTLTEETVENGAVKSGTVSWS